MYPNKVLQDTAKVLQSYLTYQAVKTIIEQLAETNPVQAVWLSNYSDRNRIQDGETYLEGLLNENKEIFLRILTVREHLAEEILEFLPKMVLTNIGQANVEHRKHLLERLTQSQSPNSELSTESTDSNSDSDLNESSQ